MLRLGMIAAQCLVCVAGDQACGGELQLMNEGMTQAAGDEACEDLV